MRASGPFSRGVDAWRGWGGDRGDTLVVGVPIEPGGGRSASRSSSAVVALGWALRSSFVKRISRSGTMRRQSKSAPRDGSPEPRSGRSSIGHHRSKLREPRSKIRRARSRIGPSRSKIPRRVTKIADPQSLIHRSRSEFRSNRSTIGQSKSKIRRARFKIPRSPTGCGFGMARERLRR